MGGRPFSDGIDVAQGKVKQSVAVRLKETRRLQDELCF